MCGGSYEKSSKTFEFKVKPWRLLFSLLHSVDLLTKYCKVVSPSWAGFSGRKCSIYFGWNQNLPRQCQWLIALLNLNVFGFLFLPWQNLKDTAGKSVTPSVKNLFWSKVRLQGTQTWIYSSVAWACLPLSFFPKLDEALAHHPFLWIFFEIKNAGCVKLLCLL